MAVKLINGSFVTLGYTAEVSNPHFYNIYNNCHLYFYYESKAILWPIPFIITSEYSIDNGKNYIRWPYTTLPTFSRNPRNDISKVEGTSNPITLPSTMKNIMLKVTLGVYIKDLTTLNHKLTTTTKFAFLDSIGNEIGEPINVNLEENFEDYDISVIGYSINSYDTHLKLFFKPIKSNYLGMFSFNALCSDYYTLKKNYLTPSRTVINYVLTIYDPKNIINFPSKGDLESNPSDYIKIYIEDSTSPLTLDNLLPISIRNDYTGIISPTYGATINEFGNLEIRIRHIASTRDIEYIMCGKNIFVLFSFDFNPCYNLYSDDSVKLLSSVELIDENNNSLTLPTYGCLAVNLSNTNLKPLDATLGCHI